MAPQQPITIIDPPAWERSTATTLSLNLLVSGGQMTANVDGQPAEWIVPSERDRVPNPPYGYIVTFARFHELGFTAPASHFMRALCYHYGVELHNFTPNAISQAATFVGVCEGFLGIPVNWDLWVLLFRAELHTLATLELRTRRVGGVHPLHDELQQLGLGAGVVLPPQHRARSPPYNGKVLRERAASWYHAVSSPSHQARLDSLVAKLKRLADRGLTAGCVLANLHHQRIVPLMERRLRIFEMSEDADPVVLAESRLLRDPFPRSYAATRARRAIDLRPGHGDDPAGQLVSGFLDFLSCLAGFLCRRRVLKLRLTSVDGDCERREVRPTHASVPRARVRGATERAGAGEPQEGARGAATGALGAEERGASAARAARTLLARDGGVLVVGRGRGGRGGRR
jgi:hypothetical protein